MLIPVLSVAENVVLGNEIVRGGQLLDLGEAAKRIKLLAGKLGGRFKTGSHFAYPDKTPMTNLLVTILDKVGVRMDKLGDSTGPLDVGTS